MRTPAAKKTLLFVGGGRQSLPGIELARQMGFRVIVSDYDPKAVGFSVADGQLLASTYDVDATLKAVQGYVANHGAIHGVLCLAVDVPLTVARIAEEFDLPGIPVESARLAMHKFAMKERFQTDGIPIPWFCGVDSASHLKQLCMQRQKTLVIKPVDSRGSRGVLRLTPGVDLDWAFSEAHRHSPSGGVMVEEYLAGPQISTESLILDGVAYTPGFSDRNYELLERYAPNFIENGGTMPSILPEEQKDAVRQLIQSAAASLGIRNGIVKGDIVVHQGRPHVIELAARLSGGYFCTHQIPLNTGVDLVKAAIHLAVGEPIDPSSLQPRFQHGVAQRYIFPEPGRVVAVDGLERVRSLEGIEEALVWVEPGDVIQPPSASVSSAGMVIAVAESRQVAVERAEAAIRGLRIHTEPQSER